MPGRAIRWSCLRSALCGVGAALCLACGGSTDESERSAVPAEFLDLCAGVDCAGDTSPPYLVGAYVGSGETTATSASLWAVGESAQFTLEIREQSADGTIAGSIHVESIDLDVEEASIRGAGSDFTIFGQLGSGEPEEMPEDCTARILGVITGSTSGVESVSTVSGSVVVRFRDVSGPGCTAEELELSEKGATFAYTAERVDGPRAE